MEVRAEMVKTGTPRGSEVWRQVRILEAERDRYRNALMTIAEWNVISAMTDLPSPQEIARDVLLALNGRERA